MIDRIQQVICGRLHGGEGCPRPGCIGECAAFDRIRDIGQEELWEAYCYIWDKDFNDSSQLAQWFLDEGATSVQVNHILYCSDNGDRDGFTVPDGARAWTVAFTIPKSGQ